MRCSYSNKLNIYSLAESLSSITNGDPIKKILLVVVSSTTRGDFVILISFIFYKYSKLQS